MNVQPNIRVTLNILSLTDFLVLHFAFGDNILLSSCLLTHFFSRSCFAPMFFSHCAPMQDTFNIALSNDSHLVRVLYGVPPSTRLSNSVTNAVIHLYSYRFTRNDDSGWICSLRFINVDRNVVVIANIETEYVVFANSFSRYADSWLMDALLLHILTSFNFQLLFCTSLQCFVERFVCLTTRRHGYMLSSCCAKIKCWVIYYFPKDKHFDGFFQFYIHFFFSTTIRTFELNSFSISFHLHTRTINAI